MYLGFQLKCPSLTKYRVFGQIFANVRSFKFHENPSSWSRTVTSKCRQTAGLRDVMKLTGAFRYFAQRPLISVFTVARFPILADNAYQTEGVLLT